jgi:uncharacterized protein (DUF983 family)
MTDDPADAALALFDGPRRSLPALRRGQAVRRLPEGAPALRRLRARLSFADSADGPAVFIMLIAGFAVLGAALYVEIAYEPPIWVHMMIWLPLAVIVCLGLLRPMKGLAVALQYAHKAEEGRREK